MRRALLAAATALALAGAAAPAAAQRVHAVEPKAAEPAWHEPEGDGWFGEDKARHFAMSFALTTMGYGGFSAVGADHDQAIAAGAAAAAAAGLWKEFHDRSLGRGFSGRDLFWDALGIGLGVLFTREIE